jgi:hypothetical protein
MLALPVEPDREHAAAAVRLWFERCSARLLGGLGDAVRAASPEQLSPDPRRPGRIGPCRGRRRGAVTTAEGPFDAVIATWARGTITRALWSRRRSSGGR